MTSLILLHRSAEALPGAGHHLAQDRPAQKQTLEVQDVGTLGVVVEST